jgi:hypothetical protein
MERRPCRSEANEAGKINPEPVPIGISQVERDRRRQAKPVPDPVFIEV